jgi:NAD(P)-dependent dehydrogenase (short-subunit alcohol dehydrogenase family)
MFATTKREFGHLDGVFVNAGYSDFRLFKEVTKQSFDKVKAVNFKGAYFPIQKALPLLRQGSSVIINASVTARKGWSCKAAVVNLARILSAELVDRAIRVNMLSPGPTDTASRNASPMSPDVARLLPAGFCSCLVVPAFKALDKLGN